MGHWKGIVGQKFRPQEFKDYVGTLRFTDWRPQFLVLHNTSEPRLSQWHSTPGEQRMLNLQDYYRGQGWSAGPHLFVADDFIWVFTPLTTSGVHSPSWNAVSWGLEMVGEYEEEVFAPAVRENVVDALAILHAWRGIDPGTLRLHKQDPLTTHKECPGRHVDQADIISRVRARMASADGGEHLPDRPGGGGVTPNVVKPPDGAGAGGLQSALLAGDPVLAQVAANEVMLVLISPPRRQAGVGTLQDALNHLAASPGGQPEFAVSLGANGQNRGFYGPRTKAAVEAFQEAHGLHPDGVTGPDTIHRLDAALLALPPADGGGAVRIEKAIAVLGPDGKPVFGTAIKQAAGPVEKEVVLDASITLFKLKDRPGYFFQGCMKVDADGAPRCYHPRPGDDQGLDELDDSTANSLEYIQGRNGVGPAEGFYVSQTALQSGPDNRCDSFVDAETIPYVIFYSERKFSGLKMGDVVMVVSQTTGRRTHAIIADSNNGTKGEASMRTAQNLGLNPSPRVGGDDHINYIYLLFPGTKFAPVQPPPHWPDDVIQQTAEAAFEAWGGMDVLRQVFPHLPAEAV